MPISQPVLKALITQKIAANIQAASGASPLSQPDPSYFIAMCGAFATGIATITTLSFTTEDNGLPVAPPALPPGVGAGTGIIVDLPFTDEIIYTTARNYVIADFGSSTHQVYPPSSDNSGIYLQAISKGIAQAIKEHFATAFTLTSSHPTVSRGTAKIKLGSITGIQENLIKTQITSSAPSLKGPYWPRMAEAVAEAIKTSITTKATGNIIISGGGGAGTTGTGRGTAV